MGIASARHGQLVAPHEQIIASHEQIVVRVGGQSVQLARQPRARPSRARGDHSLQSPLSFATSSTRLETPTFLKIEASWFATVR